MSYRIYTSRYHEPTLAARDDLAKVPISLGLPRWELPYPLEPKLLALCPTRWLLREKDYATYRERYLEQLENLGIEAVRNLLNKTHARTGQDLVLLCYEDVGKTWCHRRMLAEWYEEKTGIAIPELVESLFCWQNDIPQNPLKSFT